MAKLDLLVEMVIWDLLVETVLMENLVLDIQEHQGTMVPLVLKALPGLPVLPVPRVSAVLKVPKD
jgi:hypothetical protein